MSNFWGAVQIHFTISSDETTNPDAGKSWRWVKEEDGTYKWTPIADSDAVKALQEAARAQDTAGLMRCGNRPRVCRLLLY